MNTRRKGNYYRLKTKKYYENLGYQVMISEVTNSFRTFDLFGSDLIATKDDDYIHIQVKAASTKSSRSTAISHAKKEFRKYKVPPYIRRIIAVWEPRKNIEIIEI